MDPVEFSHSVVSDYLRPHEPQYARPPYSSPTPGVYPNPCPSSRWCHPAISSSVVPFSFCPQSFPASGSFPMSQFFAWGGQSIGVSASASVLPMNTQDWSPLGMDWLDLLAVQGTLKSLLQHHSSKSSILQCSAFFTIQLSHPTKVHLVKAMVFPVVMYGCECWSIMLSTEELMLLICGIGEDSWESLGLQGDPTSPS